MARTGSDYIRARAEAFQRLRADLLRRYFIPGMALILAAGCSVLLGAALWVQLTFFAPGFALLFIGGNRYRCPVCTRIQAAEGGIDFNPRECGHCGAILRSDGEV
jgi:hypothetical protein